MRLLIPGLFAATLLISPLSADRIVTDDGRIIMPKKARAEGEGYRLGVYPRKFSR